jgi:hypothetical protein
MVSAANGVDYAFHDLENTGRPAHYAPAATPRTRTTRPVITGQLGISFGKPV